MNKSLIFALLAAGSLTCMAQESLSDEQGNWSIMVSLNTGAFSDLFKNEPGKGTLTGDYQYSGKVVESANIVSWRGSSSYAYGGNKFNTDTEYPGGLQTYNGDGTDNYNKTIAHVEDRQVSYWIGWGDSWFADQDSGMSQGFQMGFAEGSTANIYTTPEPNLSDGTIGLGNKGHYRGDTKVADSNFRQPAEAAGAPMDTVIKEKLNEGFAITSATLALVHSNDNSGDDPMNTNQYGEHKSYEYKGGLGSFFNGGELNGKNFETENVETIAHSQTLQYLTITFENEAGQEFTITYIAEVDDGGSVAPGSDASGLLPSSNRYDVDILNKVDFNFNYVDGYKVIAGALTPEQVKGFNDFTMVPEPTSATLSMLALTALCARRRRRK